MTQIQVGAKVAELNLPNIDGSRFSIDQVAGRRYWLSFFRFASCPFCNLRVHNLIKHLPEWGDNFTVVGIFDASLEELQSSAEKHHAPFPILADQENHYYRRFRVPRSWLGVIKGIVGRFHTAIYAMFVKGYFPLKVSGHLATMPLNLLVDEQGVVQYVHSGRDEGDHIPLDQLKAFALHGEVPAAAR